MRYAVMLSLGVVVGGCTTPDVTNDIKSGAVLIAQIKAPLNAELSGQAAADLRRAEKALIASGDIVLELEGCDSEFDRDAFDMLPDCRVINNADPTLSAVNAFSVLAFLDVLDGYYASLAALASSKSADEVRVQTAALLAALEAAGAGRNDALGRLGARAAENADVIAKSVGFLANQYRVASLRRVVAKADPLIHEGAATAASFFDTPDSPMRAAQAEMFKAYATSAEAEDETTHLAALDQLKAYHTHFETARKKSPATAFRLLRRHHATLLKRLRGTPKPEEILETLIQIDEIVTALKTPR